MGMKQKILLRVALYIVAFSYIAIPLLHAAICIDCLCPAQLTAENSSLPECSQLMHFGPSRSSHPDGGDGQHRTAGRSFCSICASASGIPSSYHETPSFIAALLGPETVACVPSPPLHPLYRPPK